MTKNNESVPVSSTLTAKATGSLNKDVQKELNIPDPDKKSAKAALEGKKTEPNASS